MRKPTETILWAKSATWSAPGRQWDGMNVRSRPTAGVYTGFMPDPDNAPSANELNYLIGLGWDWIGHLAQRSLAWPSFSSSAVIRAAQPMAEGSGVIRLPNGIYLGSLGTRAYWYNSATRTFGDTAYNSPIDGINMWVEGDGTYSAVGYSRSMKRVVTLASDVSVTNDFVPGATPANAPTATATQTITKLNGVYYIAAGEGVATTTTPHSGIPAQVTLFPGRTCHAIANDGMLVGALSDDGQFYIGSAKALDAWGVGNHAVVTTGVGEWIVYRDTSGVSTRVDVTLDGGVTWTGGVVLGTVVNPFVVGGVVYSLLPTSILRSFDGIAFEEIDLDPAVSVLAVDSTADLKGSLVGGRIASVVQNASGDVHMLLSSALEGIPV